MPPLRDRDARLHWPMDMTSHCLIYTASHSHEALVRVARTPSPAAPRLDSLLSETISSDLSVDRLPSHVDDHGDLSAFDLISPSLGLRQQDHALPPWLLKRLVPPDLLGQIKVFSLLTIDRKTHQVSSRWVPSHTSTAIPQWYRAPTQPSYTMHTRL